jgi:hypothetical protein
MNTFKILFTGALALGVLGLAGADTLTLDTPVGAGDWVGSDFFGIVDLTFTPDVGEANTFAGYCTDRNVNAYIGSTWDASKLTTEDFVPPSNSTISTSSGAEIAGGEIAYLVNTFGNTADNDTAAAVQLAVWDIAEGGDGSASDNVFQTIGTELSSSIVTTAEGFDADALGMSNVDDWYEAGRDGNGNAVSQDFVSMDSAPSGSPEPFTMAIGMAGIGTFFARRTRAKRA